MALGNAELEKVIIDTVASLVIVSDAAGRIVRFNPAGTRILGYAEKEVLGQVLWDIFPLPELRERAKERFGRLMLGESLDTTTVWRTRDGQSRHISFHCRGVSGPLGEILYTIGTGIDITGRVAAERALHESLYRFRTSVNHAAIGIALADEAGRYIQVNHAFCQLTGYSEEELSVMSLLDITHPDDREENRALVKKLFTREIDSYIFEKRYRVRSGEYLWVQVSASLAPETLMQPPLVIGLFENISERHRHKEQIERANNDLKSLNETLEQRVEQRTMQLAESEKSLREAYAALEQANALLTQSEHHFKELAESNLHLAREVEHRVLNNLAGLMGLIDVMEGRETSVKSFAGAIRSRILGMRHVHTLLAQTQWSPVELAELIDGTFAALQHTAPFAADFEKSGPVVLISPQQVMPLTLVLVEWYMNSCKYGAHSVPDARLHVSWATERTDAVTRVQLRWTETNGPPVAIPITPSLGTELVKRFVRRELHGRCELHYPRTGADHVMEFDLDAALAPARRL